MRVIVIGGGNAGLCAALSAREAGASVTVVERGPFHMRGGNSRHTRDIRHAHRQPDRNVSGIYSGQEFFRDLTAVGGGVANPALAHLMVERSEDLPGWMDAQGVRWQPPLQGTLQLGRTNRFMLGGGKAMLNAYYRQAEQTGIEVRYEATVESLLINHGWFEGVEVATAQGKELLRADSVVVAAGGFEANIEWLSRSWGKAALNYHVRGTPFNDGKVLANLVAQGARTVASPRGFHAVAVDARSPRFDGGITTRLDSLPFGIVVNNTAQRFSDEGEDLWPKRYATWGGLIAEQPDQIAFSVFDSQALGHFMPSLYPAIQAATLPDLAGALNLDPGALVETVETYNQACNHRGPPAPQVLDGNGTTGLLPPKSNWAAPLVAPPYFAFPLHVGVTFTYFGVEVDEHARVIGRGGAPMGNVFAAGEIMAGNILEKGYLAGTGLTVGGVFGRIAGTEASKAIPKSDHCATAVESMAVAELEGAGG